MGCAKCTALKKPDGQVLLHGKKTEDDWPKLTANVGDLGWICRSDYDIKQPSQLTAAMAAHR